MKALSIEINAVADIFQDKIREVLVNIPGVMNLSYDILIFGKSSADHKRSLQVFFRATEKSNLTINISKCLFSKTERNFFQTLRKLRAL